MVEIFTLLVQKERDRKGQKMGVAEKFVFLSAGNFNAVKLTFPL